MTLTVGSYHCLYGSWAEKDKTINSEKPQKLLGPSIETDRFLRLLPKFQTAPAQWQLFGQSSELWFVQCYDPRYYYTKLASTSFRVINVNYTLHESESTAKELDLVVANGVDPQLTLLTVDQNGRVRQSSPVAIPIKPVDWTIDFQLPEQVRVGEELVVDVALTNGFNNCSQVSWTHLFLLSVEIDSDFKFIRLNYKWL